jgi:choloylglycine hydrolase
VAATVLKQWGFSPPVHAIVQDASGKSLVIEYVGGKLNLYDNPLGVITNSPGFDWHMTNLRN